MDYQKAYTLLVGVMSKAIDELGKSQVVSTETKNAVKMLKDGLEQAEEMYISTEE